MTTTFRRAAISILAVFCCCFISCNDSTPKQANDTYIPDSKVLYDSIKAVDSIFFAAYNSCDLEKMASFISDDIEFYHDQGGLMTSKDSIMLATKNNICGKVTRVLVAGSIEVYPIAGFGAVEMGEHYFINNQEPKPKKPAIGKFVHTWKKENDSFRLVRVISLH